jgi:hypothetical protein
METSEPIPRGAVYAPDLAEVGSMAGPFVTVYLTTESAIDNAAHLSEQRWRTLRGELAEAGAPDGALKAVDPFVAEAHQSGECLAVIATADGLVHVEHGPSAPARDIGRVAPLPSLAPIIEWRQLSPPHVTVLADREGADLIAVRYGKPDINVEAGGATDPLTKSNPGGWSQQRFQQRAENTWAENADDVAEELTKLVDRVEAGLVVAAGDVRALQLLREALPDRVGELLHVVEGGRGADGSKEEIAAEAAEQVQAVANDATEALLEKLREEAGQQDKAAEGVAATAQALSMGQVEVLLLHDEPEEDRSAWFGPDPIPVAAAPEALESLGVESAQEGRLADVLIRAALATGAGIRIIPPVGGPADGVGALLRWST